MDPAGPQRPPSDQASRPAWGEADSETYRAIAPLAVPARSEQLAVLACLIPFAANDEFGFVEIGAGAGALSATLLECFPRASGLALNGSASMRSAAALRLARFGGRARVEHFELTSTEWLSALDGCECVLSSLVLHHLDDSQKRALYGEVCARVSEGGALLIADLVHPQRAEGRELFAATWDAEARAAALALDGGDRRFEQFVNAEWNLFRHPDPVDKPSVLVDQLRWLSDAGMPVVDCFWLRAGHAIYGGYMPRAKPGGLSFERALKGAEAALSEPA